ncbi:MAG: acetyl-CoA carboxylase, carboxyltransferase subunit beta [Mycoplasmatales bacterium]
MWKTNPLSLFTSKKKDVPKDYFVKCDCCGGTTLQSDVSRNHNACPSCDDLFKIDARTRITLVTDPKSFEEMFVTKAVNNPIDFKGYPQKIKKLQTDTGLDEAVICGKAKIDGYPFMICVMDSSFIMGSMGSVVGQKLTKAIEYATRSKLPMVIYTASGGARMQEGIVSLMQMAKVSAALKRHHEAGLFYMPILTNPTTGGITASFAMLGDLIIAEPKALICFAGPRVIKDTIKAELPEGFQKSEFLLEHGFLDKIVPRSEQKLFIKKMIEMHS